MTNLHSKLALVLVMMIVSTQANGRPNLIGVYADSTGQVVSVDETGLIQCYVVVEEIEDPSGISGWQFQLQLDDNSFFSSPVYPAGALNLESFPRFMVGCSEPIALSGASAVIFEFSVYAVGPGSVYLNPLDESRPVAYAGAADGTIIRFQHKFGGTDERVFSYGGAPDPIEDRGLGVVSIEHESWGSLKSSYFLNP